MLKTNLNLNLTELQILHDLTDGPASMKLLQGRIGNTFAWTFKCIDHLKNLGFVLISKRARASQIAIASTVLGNRLMTFLKESDFPDPELVLKGRSLRILTLLIPNGLSNNEIIKISGLSRRTVVTYLKKWQSAGLVIFKRPTYRINPRHNALIELLRAFSEQTNISTAGSLGVPYSMLWQGGGEFIISVDQELGSPGFSKAADSALDKYGLDLVHRSEYYLYNPSRRKISKAEAIVQTMIIDRNEPRRVRLFYFIFGLRSCSVLFN